MSVFYHNDDPLLRQPLINSAFANNQMVNNPNNVSDMYANLYKQQLLYEIQQQNSNNNSVKDWIGDLDKEMKCLDSNIIEMLNGNTEFSTLNSQLQSYIQNELISLIKVKINSNNEVVENIKKQIGLINDSKEAVRSSEKRNLSVLNDYMKNYSHLTFDEFKRLKNGSNENEENKAKKNKKQ